MRNFSAFDDSSDSEEYISVWDPTSHTYKRVLRSEMDIADRNHASGGDNNLFDPTRTEDGNYFKPKNPLMEGYMAKLDHDIGPQTCEECNGSGRTLAGDACPHCEGEGRRKVTEFDGQVQEHNSAPFPDRTIKPNRFKTDNSFPSMSSHSKRELDQKVTYDLISRARIGKKEFINVIDEMQFYANQPGLDGCVECSAPMTEHQDEKVCHSCGHRQPIVYTEANQKNALFALPELAAVPEMLGIGGEAGGAGMAGQLMNKALGGAAFKAGEDALSGMLGNPGEAQIPTQPSGAAPGTVSHQASPMQYNREDPYQFVWRYDKDGPGVPVSDSHIALSNGYVAVRTNDQAAMDMEHSQPWRHHGDGQGGSVYGDTFTIYASDGTPIATVSEDGAESAPRNRPVAPIIQRASEDDARVWETQDAEAIQELRNHLQGGHFHAKTAAGAFGDKETGGAIKNDGLDHNPANKETQGFNEEHGSAPELLKDVDGVGGTKDSHGLQQFMKHLPMILEIIESGQPQPDNPDLLALDELLEAEFPGYRNQDDSAHMEIDVMDDASADHDAPKENKYDDNSKPDETPKTSMVPMPPSPSMPSGPSNAVNQPCPLCGADDCPHKRGQQGNAVPNPMANPGAVGPTMAKRRKVSVRRPKMCPFHSELVEYSLVLSDPKSALGALAGHQFSDQSCKGGWGGDFKCRFRPEFVNQSYWDNKQQELEERRLLRQQPPEPMHVETPPQQPQPSIEPSMESAPVEPPTMDMAAPEPAAPDMAMAAKVALMQPVPGQPVQAQPETFNNGQVPLRCAYCGNENPPGTAVCPTCGHANPQAQQGQQPSQTYISKWVITEAEMDHIHEDEQHQDAGVKPVHDDNDTWIDGDGNDLVEGQDYNLASTHYEIPDKVTVEQIRPDKIIVILQGDQPYRKELTREEIVHDGLTFKPLTTDHDMFNDDTFNPHTNDDYSHAGGPVEQDDLSRPTAGFGHSRPLPTPHYAGKDFSAREQREFIDEEGPARNLERLDLTGTHYIDHNGIDAHFLWN